MGNVMAVFVYLLIGGFIVGGACSSSEVECDGDGMSDEKMIFVAVAWPAVIGMGLGGAIAGYDDGR